ncbi:unnamed protein product [Moneuplotes crassus]|uniref:Uncharacterized protein n=2 Tax=Euplotes crassus TaxID=5936 RepID=A0AAD1U307_EUPCR|nr:unnamed protein product [Moneuplotes crassus]
MEKDPAAVAGGGVVVELDHAIGYSGKIVNSVHLHPNANDYVLIAGASIIVGDINDPHNQHFLRGHDDQITCLDLSCNGKMIASGQKGDNSDILIWDYESKKAVFRLSEHDNQVDCLHFSHDDMLLISSGDQLDGKLFIWDTSNGYIVTSMQLLPTVISEAPNCISFGGFVKDIKLRETSSYQFATSGSKKLMLWSLEPSTGNLEYELVSTGTFIRDYICFAFGKPKEEYLFAGTKSGDFVSFQIKHKLLVFVQNVCAQGVTCISVVTEDKVCCGGGDGTLALYHVDGKFCQELLKTTLAGGINGLSSSEDGIQLLVSTDRGFIYRVRVSDFSCMLLGENHISDVLQVSFMDGISDKFATCSEDTTIRLWDSNDYSVYARCAVLAGGHPTCCSFTEEVVISGWSDGKIRSFRTDNCELLWAIDNAHKNGVTTLCISHNFKFLATGGYSGDVRVWEIRSRELISHLKEHTSTVTKVEVLEDDIHLLSCARDKAILCWDLKNEKRLSNHTQRMGGINGFSFNPENQNKVLSVGQERKVTYWDLSKSEAEGVVDTSSNPSESDEQFSIDISKDGRYFVTGGSLGILRIWDYTEGKIVSEQAGHSNTITSVSFTPDGKQVISTGRDGLVLVWNVFT